MWSVIQQNISALTRWQWGFLAFIATILFALGIGSEFWLFVDDEWQECRSAHPLLDATFYCSQNRELYRDNISALKDRIQAVIAEESKQDGVELIAYFFRDLDSKKYFGVNDLEDFSPASLLKVPLTIFYFNQAEEHPGLLDRQLVYAKRASEMPIQTIKPEVRIVENQPYPIKELLRNIIIYSDNASYEVLLEYVRSLPEGPSRLLHTYQELGLLDPRDNLDETLTVREYSSLFRVLYNSAYLDFEHSEMLLQWLVEAKFANGLRRGIPESVMLANKFGERSIKLPDGSVSPYKQLHDCGLVYVPDRPYIICVMTKGKDTDILASVIGRLSRETYELITSEAR